MVKKVFAITTSIGIALFMLQILFLTVNLTGVEAYPAPPAPATPAGYPGPGQPTSQPPQPPQPPPATMNYESYLPLFATPPCCFHFGIGGADQAHTTPVIPDCAIDGYLWERSPNPDSTVQLIRRCHSNEGVSQQYLCWVDNSSIFHPHFLRYVRPNLAHISTPAGHPPSVSSHLVNYGATRATDNYINTDWVSNSNSVSEWLAIDLHPTYLDLISITWGTDYAKAYQIEVKDAGSPSWTQLYTTTIGNGGVDMIPVTHAPLVEEIRIYMTQPAITGHEYSLKEFQVYGTTPVPLFQRGLLITQWITSHVGNTWLIGNEPDNFDLRYGDGLTPTTYAEFFVTLGNLIKASDPSAELVFCQASFAYAHGVDLQFQVGGGPTYCEQAYQADPAGLEPLIDALSTHQYIYTPITSQAILNVEMAQWKGYLNEFVKWTENHNWQDKPLYLTEYGDFDNPCPYQNAPPEVCGTVDDGYAFWGEHYQEGFWAIQYHTTEYFLSSANQRWEAAWWFVIGWQRKEAVNGGLYEIAVPDKTLNDNGEHLRDSISCFLHSLNCPILGWGN